MPLGSGTPRFLTLLEVSEVLNISERQAYALVRRGELAGIRVGGKGQWRVEHAQLEDYIDRQYHQTRDYIRDHPYEEDGETSARSEPGRLNADT